MSYSIRKAAVLGAGVMGSGIAAHLANAGIPVLLLDIVPFKAEEGEDTSSKAFRNKFAASALKAMPKTKPAPHFSKKALDLIEVGNFEDDLEKLADVDWVCEAIIERLDIKQELFAKLEKIIPETAIVSSNTSGLKIADMVDGRGEAFRKHFMVTHFFNPVRYMKLLELVSGEETDSDVFAFMAKFSEETLGKGVVFGKDTTNFVANRIGVYGMMKTFDEMQKAELTVEEVDKIFGPATGRPRTAVFRTADLVGLDTFDHVAQNCYDSLVDDEERDMFLPPPVVKKMVEKGWLGKKSGFGFYKKDKDADGKRIFLTVDFNTVEHTPSQQVSFDSIKAAKGVDDVRKRVAGVMKADDKAGKFAATVTLGTLAYTSRRIPEIADDVVNIDRGMRWGFGWDIGPFEVWDAYGVAEGVAKMEELGFDIAPWVGDMLAAGRESFYAVEDGIDTYWDIPSKSSKPVPKSDREVTVEFLKRGDNVIDKNFGATLVDMGDGIACLEFHTKMNSIDQDIITMLNKSLDIVEKDFKGLVVGNDSDNFSVGANIMMIMMAAQQKAWDQIEDQLKTLQNAVQRMRYSPVPVVTAPTGLTLGGGAEITMGGNAIQAAAELYIGLVEFGVGLIPGATGSIQLLRNLYGPFADNPDFDAFPFIKKVFLAVGMAQVATSAEEAQEAGFLKYTDGISMNRSFVLSDAKARCLGMADAGFRPPRATRFMLSGPSAKATIDMLLTDMMSNGHISEHDKLIGSKLAGLLTGGDTSPGSIVTEEKLMEIEREAFLSLCGEEKTQARIMYMLQKNKPLRN